MDVLYHPNLDDPEHACKLSKSGCFVQSNFLICDGTILGFCEDLLVTFTQKATRWMSLQTKEINSQVNEQVDSGIQKIQGQLAHMNIENFKIHCSLFLALKNMDKKFGISVQDLHL